MPVIGIDIGTSYSCVGTVVDGQVRLFPTEKGNNLLPSIVAFDQGRCLVGEAAKSKLTESPENVIYDIARIIGRSRADKHLTLDEKKWPFCISEHQGRVGVNVTHKNQPTTFTAEEILAILLMHLKQMAQTALRKPVGEAVICIPAHFNNQQRLATTSAARIAGLKVTQLISAPAAAAIAYRREMNIYKEQKLLVLVMGGGTCDVSVITTKDDIIQVDATAGDCHLGGTDLDANLADYLVDQFRTKYGKDFSANHVAVQRLRLACETAKRTLSVSARAHVSIPDIHENLRLSARLTRTEFESMNADIFNKILNLVELVVEDAMITKNSIDDIVLVGGSSWIPKVQEVLTTFFDGKPLNRILSPQEAVCTGVAIYANHSKQHNGTSSSENSMNATNHMLTEVSPFSLGIEVKGGRMNYIIRRNTPIPIRDFKRYTTTVDEQDSLSIVIFEGENTSVAKNTCLGKFHLTGFSAAPAGVPNIKVVFDVDANGILNVKAYDETARQNVPLPITCDSTQLTPDDIVQLAKQMERLWEENGPQPENH
ncbi:hypothetical protein T265_01251 [Opisthorchis viverrini]|uniref:DnaK family protein n=1 Tax=Opisthorchis viverrini TaxID=6198 RepID=A0A074ZZ99_OPIVI|nr:hypothetical protein T265_01251 [Opisthorchis viverrini]KER32768.1 hypothetical protein T265_01251 [Opisthorchis viverrini]